MNRAGSFCPVCGTESQWHPFVSFENIPHTGIFPASSTTPISCRDLVFEYCQQCALLRRQPHSFVPPDYQNVDRPTSAQLPQYLTEHIHQLTQRYSTDSTVIDVGGNDGAFLRLFQKMGYLHCLNVEPSRTLAQISKGYNIQTLCGALEKKSVQEILRSFGQAKIISLRHVLEHVADPVEMLQNIHALLDDDGVLLIEVPAVSSILEKLLAHDLWEEHLYYYSSSTITRLLQNTGFESVNCEIQTHRGSDVIIIYAQKRKREILLAQQEDAVLRELTLLKSFAQQWKFLCIKLNIDARSWSKPIYALGASHPQSNFLHYSKLGAYVDVVIDDDPAKIGRYLKLPNPVPIISSAQFVETAIKGTLLMTAWGCKVWTKKMQELADQKSIQTLFPYGKKI